MDLITERGNPRPNTKNKVEPQKWDRALVMSMTSRYLGLGKEEILFEDADGFWLLRFENSEVVRSDFFYKPGAFISSKCEILADYLVCAARMKVGISSDSKLLLPKNFLFVWKKQKVIENQNNGFTYRIIKLHELIHPKFAMIVENPENNCVSFLDLDERIKSICFNIFNVKLALSEEGQIVPFEQLTLEVVGNDFYLNKTSKFTQILPASEFLIPPQKRGPRWGIIILLGCIIILSIGCCRLHKHYTQKKEETFTLDSSLLTKKETS